MSVEITYQTKFGFKKWMYIKCKFVFLFPNKTFYSNSANLDEFTDLGEKCLESKCGKGNNTSFNWCYTDSRPANISANFSGSWDYCTPKSGFLISFTFFQQFTFTPPLWPDLVI